MLRNVTLKDLRACAWATVGLGILISLVFTRWFYRSVSFNVLVWYAPPYILVAAATLLSGTRGVALVAFLGAVSVLALGAYTCIDLIRTAGGINDIELFTTPLELTISLLVLVIAFVGFLVTRVKDV